MILLLALACGGEEEPKPFQDFKDVFHPVLVVNAGALPDQGEAIQVFVHPDRSGACRTLDKLTANVDGVPLTRLHGRVPGENGYDRDCMVYEFTADTEALKKRPDSVDGTVTVTDGVTTISSTTKNLFGPRSLEAEPITPDGKVRLRWVPGGDTLSKAVKPSVILRGVFKEVVLRAPALVVTPEAVEFTLPAEAAGEMTAELTGTLAIQPTVTACVGAFRCESSRAYVVPPVSLKR